MEENIKEQENKVIETPTPEKKEYNVLTPSGEGVPLPSPNPTPLPPKTFDWWGGGAAGVRSGVSGKMGLGIKKPSEYLSGGCFFSRLAAIYEVATFHSVCWKGKVFADREIWRKGFDKAESLWGGGGGLEGEESMNLCAGYSGTSESLAW